jgi:Lrp/AsnC family leucine-responsive transcriptional regulator
LRSVGELEALIDRLVPYATANSSLVQSSPVKRRLPPLLLPRPHG